MTEPRDKEPCQGPASISSGATHVPIDALWATYVEYMQENGVDIEALDAQAEAFARKRSRRLAAAHRLGKRSREKLLDTLPDGSRRAVFDQEEE